ISAPGLERCRRPWPCRSSSPSIQKRPPSGTSARRSSRSPRGTMTICRKCYVHPHVLDCYLAGTLVETLKQKIGKKLRKDLAMLRPEEAATLALLGARLNRN